MRSLLRISPREAKALFEQLRRAWRYEELVPQPEGYISIPLKRIRPPAWVIRKELGDLEELKRSIGRAGLLQPICVKPVDPSWREFEPVIGVRRYYACRELKLERVPCYIRPYVDEEGLATLALEENRHRKDLTQAELLKSMEVLRAKGYTLERISEHVDMSVADVSIYLRIPKLPKPVRDAFFRGQISFGHIKVLVGLEESGMLESLERVRGERLSVRMLEDLIAIRGGKLELPPFLRSKGLDGLLGTKLMFRRGRGVSLSIKASDEAELLEILARVGKEIRR